MGGGGWGWFCVYVSKRKFYFFFVNIKRTGVVQDPIIKMKMREQTQDRTEKSVTPAKEYLGKGNCSLQESILVGTEDDDVVIEIPS